MLFLSCECSHHGHLLESFSSLKVELIISEKREGHLSPASQTHRGAARSKELLGEGNPLEEAEGKGGEGASQVSSGLAEDEEGRQTLQPHP